MVELLKEDWTTEQVKKDDIEIIVSEPSDRLSVYLKDGTHYRTVREVQF